MARRCCITTCHSRSIVCRFKGKGIGFYRFPRWKKNSPRRVSEVTKRRRMAWIAAVRRPDITFTNIPPHLLVCSKHFHKGKPANEMLEWDPDWAPSLHLDTTEAKATTIASIPAGYDPLRERARAKHIQPAITPNTGTGTDDNTNQIHKTEDHTNQNHETEDHANQIHENKDHANQIHEVSNTPPHESQETISISDGEEEPQQRQQLQQEQQKRKQKQQQQKQQQKQECMMCSLKLKELIHLRRENRKLKHELSKKTLNENFLQNDEKVQFYTGLPTFGLLMDLLMQILSSLPIRLEISPFQMLLLTFMRLKLNLPLEHIAHLFDISHTLASSLFYDTVNVLYTQLRPLVHWPKRHGIQASAPHQHIELFSNPVAVVIDCFELFIEGTQNLYAKAERYSNDKTTHTMKYLIGITPQGTISFISSGWGGRCSDKLIAENCGFLQKLLPGDVVLADCKFEIKEHVVRMGATLKVPKVVGEMKNVTRVRGHVEHVISCLRSNYTFLNDPVPVGFMVPFDGVIWLDKIVIVACALTNMCTSFVQKQQLKN